MDHRPTIPARLAGAPALVLAIGIVCLVALPACKTQQTITPKSSRYAIDEEAWNKSGGEPGDEFKKKDTRVSYADAFGEDEDGGDAQRSSLEDRMFSGAGTGTSDITDKEFRGTRDYGEAGEFRTPEFLRRQELRTKEAREAGRADARYGQVAYRDGEQSFRGGDQELSFWQRLNPFRKRDTPAREADRTFIAGDYTPANRAADAAPSPQPMATFGEGLGDYRDSTMSMDDVKKLVNPESFR